MTAAPCPASAGLFFCAYPLAGVEVPVKAVGPVGDGPDHCEALLRVLEAGRPGEVYNIGGNNEQSNIELTRAILDLMGFGEEMIDWVEDRPGHDRRYAIDASKIRQELGWAPTRSAWPEALGETIEWYRTHEAWWRPLQPSA